MYMVQRSTELSTMDAAIMSPGWTGAGPEGLPMTSSVPGRSSTQATYCVPPKSGPLFSAIPVWISDEVSTPSIPIHVLEASSFTESGTAGTIQFPWTWLNVAVEPASTAPDQLRDRLSAPAVTSWGRRPPTGSNG